MRKIAQDVNVALSYTVAKRREKMHPWVPYVKKPFQSILIKLLIEHDRSSKTFSFSRYFCFCNEMITTSLVASLYSMVKGHYVCK